MSAQPPSGGYSLFPNPNSKPPTVWRPASRTRTSESRERSRTRAVSPETVQPIDSTSPPHHGRQTPQQRIQSPVERSETPQGTRQPPLSEPHNSPSNRELPPLPSEAASPVMRPPPAAEVPPRTDTALSQSQTLARGNSHRSRSSIAKLPLPNEPSSSSQEQTALRSIFPQYNPEIPLNQQQYFPTQTSPTHIPRAVINRTTWYPQEGEEDGPEPQHRSPVRSPMSGSSAPTWPRRRIEPPIIPNVSTNEQMKSMWKVTNGWKASASEGRVFCMKMSQEKDAPIYTLSSTSQPFYNLRLDPTSASAYVTVSRHDPSKVYKAPSPTAGSSASSILSGVVGNKDNGKGAESKHWQEVLTTTLEEESRKHPPNDGLVALLYPQAAAKMALDRPDDMTAIVTAETECARLVWDDDSSSHFLVHPALATPFCVTIERSPAWSRVEYTLEHHESPQHLAKLTRDGTGGGFLEVDTAIASKIDCFFIVDVAVTALLLVAASDEKNSKVETFEPPPAPREPAGSERRLSKREEKKRAAAARKGKMEEFEIDIESQDSSFAKLEQVGKETRDKLPWPLRALVKVLTGLFKCFVWVLTIGFKALAAIVKGLARCVGVKSK